jgi:hypothetical protein
MFVPDCPIQSQERKGLWLPRRMVDEPFWDLILVIENLDSGVYHEGFLGIWNGVGERETFCFAKIEFLDGGFGSWKVACRRIWREEERLGWCECEVWAEEISVNVRSY